MCAFTYVLQCTHVYAVCNLLTTQGKIKIRPSVQQLISCSKTYLHSSICDGGDIEVDAGAVCTYLRCTSCNTTLLHDV